MTILSWELCVPSPIALIWRVADLNYLRARVSPGKPSHSVLNAKTDPSPMVLKTGGGTEVQKMALGSSCLPWWTRHTGVVFKFPGWNFTPVFLTDHLRYLPLTLLFHITKQFAWLRCGYFHPASLQLRLSVDLSPNPTNTSVLGNHKVTGSITLQKGKSIEQNQQSALQMKWGMLFSC